MPDLVLIEITDCPRPVLGAEVVGNDPDFLQAFRVRHDRGFVVASAHHRQTIQLNVIRERAPAVDADRRQLASSGHADAERIQVRGVRGCGARHGACLQKRVGQRVLGDVRQRLDHLGADGSRHARAVGLQQRRLG